MNDGFLTKWDVLAEDARLRGIKLRRTGNSLSLVVNDPLGKLDDIHACLNKMEQIAEECAAPPEPAEAPATT
jgi:hypothetical protein